MNKVTLTINLQGPTPEDPISIYHLAQGFFLAGDRCALNIATGPRSVQSLLSPSVVNFCFSIELFCKALIQASGSKPKKVHNLDELFKAMPSDVQAAVAEMYNQEIQTPTLTDLLAQASNYFQEVRYNYEYGVYAYQETPLAILAKCMYRYCSDVIER